MRKVERIELKEPRLSRREFNRRADDFLKKVQEKLLPEHARELVAINMVTGEYVLGETLREACIAYTRRWPKILFYLSRVDGGPAIKYHGK